MPEAAGKNITVNQVAGNGAGPVSAGQFSASLSMGPIAIGGYDAASVKLLRRYQPIFVEYR